MNVRNATFADLGDICALIHEFFQQTSHGELNGLPVTREGILMSALQYVKNPHTLVLVGEDTKDQHICGLFVAEMFHCLYNNSNYARDVILYIRRGARAWLDNGLPLVDKWMKKYDATHLIVEPTKAKNNKALARLLETRGFKMEGYVLRYGKTV